MSNIDPLAPAPPLPATTTVTTSTVMCLTTTFRGGVKCSWPRSHEACVLSPIFFHSVLEHLGRQMSFPTSYWSDCQGARESGFAEWSDFNGHFSPDTDQTCQISILLLLHPPFPTTTTVTTSTVMCLTTTFGGGVKCSWPRSHEACVLSPIFFHSVLEHLGRHMSFPTSYWSDCQGARESGFAEWSDFNGHFSPDTDQTDHAWMLWFLRSTISFDTDYR